MNHLKANQQIVYKVARQAGLSRQSSLVIAANFTGESLANPYLKKWDIRHFSQGIAQWDDVRSARIARKFGKEPHLLSVAEQVSAFLWEIGNYYPQTFRALHNDGLTPNEKMFTVVHDFERPHNPYVAVKQRMKFYNGLEGWLKDADTTGAK